MKKTKRCELEFGKAKAYVKGYDFCDPRAPDVLLHGTGDVQWKVVLKYNCANHAFALYINDTAFVDLLIQVEIIPDGPQNIMSGEVKFNGLAVHENFK